MGEVLIKKLINHSWYLNEECAIFTLFDDRIDDKTKYKMEKRILEINEEKTQVK